MSVLNEMKAVIMSGGRVMKVVWEMRVVEIVRIGSSEGGSGE